MFKVKFETRDDKYFLELGGKEICLSSETPKDIYNDDDIKDIVTKALEAYHKYQGDKFQQYLDQQYLSDIVNAKEDINVNTFDFQIGQKVVIIGGGAFDLNRGIIIGFDDREIIVKIRNREFRFVKNEIYFKTMDNRIKIDTEIIFNGKYTIIKGTKIIDEHLHYEINVDNKRIIIPFIEDLIFAEIDKTKKGIFVQINIIDHKYDKWYGYIKYKIKQLDKYVVNIENNNNILIKLEDIIEIDIKNNNDKNIQINDVIKTISNGRYGIIRCHAGREYYIDFGGVHNYSQHKFSKMNISQ